jgi:putative ABC transport system substrate-binding protein
MAIGRLTRLELGAWSVCAALACPLGAQAQQAAVPVIGILNMQLPATEATRLDAYRLGLQQMGFAEGRNIAIENRFAEGRNDRLRPLAAELVDRRVAVLMANTTPPALAAKAATSTIPIVFLTGVDPVKVGLVSSLNRPGGNITGVTFLVNQVVSKRLELLCDVLPKDAPVGMLADRNNLNAAPDINDAQIAASGLRRTLHVEQVTGPDDIDAAVASLIGKGAKGLFIAPNANFRIWHAQILALTMRHSLPVSAATSDLVNAGSLMSYGPDQLDSYRQAGELTGRILKGEKPATLPVMQATKFDFALNLKSAKALGLTISPTMLALATTVIE